LGVEEGTWKGQGAGGVGLMGLARVGLGTHMETYHEAIAASSNYFDIIRMKREGVEKAGVAGLMRGVQEMGIRGGKREVLGKEGGARRWRKSQNPHASKTDAVPRPCPVIRGLPPPSTSPCAAKYLKKCNIELEQRCLTYLRDYPKSYLTCS